MVGAAVDYEAPFVVFCVLERVQEDALGRGEKGGCCIVGRFGGAGGGGGYVSCADW